MAASKYFLLLAALFAAFALVLVAARSSVERTERAELYRQYHQFKEAEHINFGEPGSPSDLHQFEQYERLVRAIAKSPTPKPASGKPSTGSSGTAVTTQTPGSSCTSTYYYNNQSIPAAGSVGIYFQQCPASRSVDTIDAAVPEAEQKQEQRAARPSPTMDFVPSWTTFSLQGSVGDTPVRNQGACANCWAAAAAELLEFGLAAAGVDPVPLLSAGQVFACATVADNTQASPSSNGSCSPANGTPEWALEYITTDGRGILYPDNQWSFNSYGCSPVIYGTNSWNPQQHWASGYTYVGQWAPNGSERQMYTISANGQAIIAHIDALGDSTFASLTTGVFSSTSCSRDILNHAIVIIGVKADPVCGGPAWHIKNSFGASWGVNGYGLITAGWNMCGISEYGLTLTVS